MSPVFSIQILMSLVTNRRPGVAGQRPGQQVGLAEDLEAVADAQHRQARAGGRDQLRHHRREPGDRAAAQVVAVGEAAGQHHGVDAVQAGLAVPQRYRGAARQPDRAAGVLIVEGARKGDDSDPGCQHPKPHATQATGSAGVPEPLPGHGGDRRRRRASRCASPATPRCPDPGRCCSVTSSTQARMMARPRPDSGSWAMPRCGGSAPRPGDPAAQRDGGGRASRA